MRGRWRPTSQTQPLKRLIVAGSLCAQVTPCFVVLALSFLVGLCMPSVGEGGESHGFKGQERQVSWGICLMPRSLIRS